MKLTVLTSLMALLVCFGFPAVAGAGDAIGEEPPPTEWTVPDCDYIQCGVPITYTTDEGLNLAHASQMRFVEFCLGLETLDQPNTMLAVFNNYSGAYLVRSFDAGCKWKTEARLLPSSFRLAIGPGEIAYIYLYGSDMFYRWDGEEIEGRKAPDVIYGFAVNPNDASNIRIGSEDCQLWESIDGGINFLSVGEPAVSLYETVYTMEFNPHRWGDALCGTEGAYRTIDAGQSWEPVIPFDPLKNDRVFRFEYSPTDPDVVWARANMDLWNEGTRDILMSVTGGSSFTSIVQQGEQAVDQDGIVRNVTLSNGPTMAGHPDHPNVLYFVCSGHLQNYATDLFRYDALTDELTVVHIDSVDGIASIAFNPADASVMYLGMVEGNDPSPGPELPEEPEEPEAQISATVSPNPFNPSAIISFSLPRASQVRLDVYNILGQRIATLADSYLSAGEHSFTWDGSKAASGMYMYRLRAGETVTTEKMMLLK